MKVLKSLGIAMIAIIFGAGIVSAEFNNAGCPGMMGKGMKGHHMGQGGKGGKMFRVLRMLDLDDSQKDEVKQINDKYKADREKIVDNIRQYRETLTQSIHGDEYNEENIRAAHNQISKEREEMVVLKAKIFSEIKAILTPEQLEKLKTAKADKNCQKRGKGRHCKRGGSGGGCKFSSGAEDVY